MRTTLWICLLLAVLLPACVPYRAFPAQGHAARTLTVFAAASLTDAFGDLTKSFEAEHPDVQVALNFAGSQALRTQIDQGAPADVFASASSADMDKLVTEDLVDRSSVELLLINKLIVIVPPTNPANLGSIQDLSRAGLKLVLASSDVPVGKYSRLALNRMTPAFGADYERRVLANLVSNEDSVKQVVAKVQLGEADAGIVYKSDAVAAPDLITLEIPAQFNVTADYVIAPLRESHDAKLAVEFMRYVRSSAARAVLAKWGFGPTQ